MFNPLKYFRNRSVGLALGSGGAKGISHISVIENLQELKIPISMIAGSSIGAVIGALFAAGRLQDFKKDLLALTSRGMISLFDLGFPRSGLLQGGGFMDFLGKYIPPDKLIEELDIPLAVTATDFNTGKSVVFRSGAVLEALRASISVPGIFKPVRFKGTFLIDGGVANPLPINICRMMGAGLTIAVNLHPVVKPGNLKSILKNEHGGSGITEDSGDIESPPLDDNFQKGAGSSSWFKSLDKWVSAKKHEEKLPSIFEVIFQSVNIMELANTRLILKHSPPNVLIEPDLPEIGTLDFNKGVMILAEGNRAAAQKRGLLLRKIKLWV